VLRLRRPSTRDIDRLLAEARASTPTYPEVGATKSSPLPVGYRHDTYELRLGQGREVFNRAVTALRSWQAQIGAGVDVFPHGAQVDDQATVVLRIRVGALWAMVPCRVVYLTEEADRFAFAYGTLPGHAETGEAAFTIECDESGEVVFRILSFSRTVDPLARLGTPITRRIQQRVTAQYLTAIAEASSG
jgi:uncharacterized protein (UPF0548 family)